MEIISSGYAEDDTFLTTGSSSFLLLYISFIMPITLCSIHALYSFLSIWAALVVVSVSCSPVMVARTLSRPSLILSMILTLRPIPAMLIELCSFALLAMLVFTWLLLLSLLLLFLLLLLLLILLATFTTALTDCITKARNPKDDILF